MKEKQTIPAYMLLLLWVSIVCFSFSWINYSQPANYKTTYTSQGKAERKMVTKAESFTVTVTEPIISLLLDQPEVLFRELYTSVSGYNGLQNIYRLPTTAIVLSGVDLVILMNLLQPNAP